MKLRVITGLVLTLSLMGILTLAFNIQPVKASGTIYIKADGSIDPPTAPISSVDNVTYTFTGNINDSIRVERNNIVVDGVGYILQGTEARESKGIDLTGRSNVTIKNIEIKAFWYGVWLYESSNNTLSGNNITANKQDGIYLASSNNNTISGNIVANTGAGIIRIVGAGIYLYRSSNYNTISGNNITNNWRGIDLSSSSSSNSVSGNNIANNQHGIGLWRSSNNTIFGNNITANKGDGIGLDFSSNCSVVGNNIANNWDGVRLSDTLNSSIVGNNITANNEYGIWINRSHNNSISENNITANKEAGMFLSTKSSNNVIYHNNFVNSRNKLNTDPFPFNVWDNGYPSGGNYWSDYRGVDKYSGPYQNETGSDGIGDTPYVIDANNRDRYPLMGPPPAEAFPMWIIGVAVATIAVAAAIAVFWRKRKKPLLQKAKQ